MALSKKLTLPNTVTGSYISIGYMRVDDLTQEASFGFHLWANQTAKKAAPKHPLYAGIAKLRLTGADFETYLGSAAMKGSDHKRQAYKAAAAMPKKVMGALATVNGTSILAGADSVLEPGQAA